MISISVKVVRHLMVSAGVCYGGKGQLHFIEEKAKVNAEYYVNKILPNLIEDCRRILPGQFIFQQDGLRLTQRHWRRTGLAEIAQSLSGRKSDHRIHLISTLLTIMCGVRCLTSINVMYRSQRTFQS